MKKLATVLSVIAVLVLGLQLHIVQQNIASGQSNNGITTWQADQNFISTITQDVISALSFTGDVSSVISGNSVNLTVNTVQGGKHPVAYATVAAAGAIPVNVGGTSWSAANPGDLSSTSAIPPVIHVNTINGTGAFNTMVNAVTQFGAVADGRVVDDGVCNGTTTVTSATAAWSSSRDATKGITVVNTATGAILANTTIMSVTNSSTIILAAICTAGTGARIGWGTDVIIAGQSSIDAIENNTASGMSIGGAVYWPRASAAGLYYYSGTTTGFQMNGSVPTVATRSRPVSFVGDPATHVGPDGAGQDLATFFFPAIPGVLPGVATSAAFLNYSGAVGCLAQAKVEDIGFKGWNDGNAGSGLGPIGINISSQDGVFLGTQGHPLYFGELGGGIQLYNTAAVPQCSIAVAGAGFTETNEIYAFFELAAQPIRYLTQIGATTTTTSGPITIGAGPTTIPVVSTAGFPPSNVNGIAVAVLNANGGGFTPLGPNVACTGVTPTSLTGCSTGAVGTINSGATIAMTGHPSFNGSGCRFCYINRYSTPPTLPSIYMGPNTFVYDAPMDVHFFGNGSSSVMIQNDAPGIFGGIPELYGTINGEGGGWLATGLPFRFRGQTLVNQFPGALIATNDLAAESGVQRNLIPNSEANGSTSWSLSDFTEGQGVLPDGGNGFVLTGTGATATPLAVSTPMAVDGNQVTDGIMSSGSFILKSASAGWYGARDLYKWVIVPGAGASTAGTAGALVGQIVAVPTATATAVTLNVAAETAVSGATVNWGQFYSLSAYADMSNVSALGPSGFGPTLELTTSGGTLLTFTGFPVTGPGNKGRLEIPNIIPPGNSVVVRFNGNSAVIPAGLKVSFSEPMFEAAAYPMAYMPGVIFPTATPFATPTIPIGLFATPGATPEVASLPCTMANNGQLAIVTNEAGASAATGYTTPVPTATAGVQVNAICHGPTSSWLIGW